MPKPKRRAPLIPLSKTPSRSSDSKDNRHHVKDGNSLHTSGGSAGARRRVNGEAQTGGDPISRPVGKRVRESADDRSFFHAAKRRKGTGAPAQRPQKPSSGGGGKWRPLSAVHQQSAFAVQRLLEADRSRKHGASLKSLTLAPHIVAKKATYAVTCQVLKFSRLLAELDDLVQLSANQPKLDKYVAMVLMYELLRGEGLARKGQAERAVLAAEARLRALADDLMRKAGVESLDDLMAVQQQQQEPGSGPAGPGSGASGGSGGGPTVPHPRWVRVNTLKAEVADAVQQLDKHLQQQGQKREKKGREAAGAGGVVRDPLLPDLLALPPGTDLHDHMMVTRGSVVLQSKASCMPAHALAPKPGWTVVDCCAAPGNKTTHLAALMGNKGRVIAFDKDPLRLARLKANAALTGASCIEARLGDFLSIDPTAPEYRQVRGVLLDPSCSGSGTTFTRMDHLLPSHFDKPRHGAPSAAAAPAAAASADAPKSKPTSAATTRGPASTTPIEKGPADLQSGAAPARRRKKGLDSNGNAPAASPHLAPDPKLDYMDLDPDLDPEQATRVAQLAKFQSAALAHALRFPSLERLVYSTCSVHVAENEAVVAGAMEAAEAAGMELADPFPSWHRRGLPLIPGAEKLVRTDAYQDGTDGFFVAVFQRRGKVQEPQQQEEQKPGQQKERRQQKPRQVAASPEGQEVAGGEGEELDGLDEEEVMARRDQGLEMGEEERDEEQQEDEEEEEDEGDTMEEEEEEGIEEQELPPRQHRVGGPKVEKRGAAKKRGGTPQVIAPASKSHESVAAKVAGAGSHRAGQKELSKLTKAKRRPEGKGQPPQQKQLRRR